jgi:predicted exporter
MLVRFMNIRHSERQFEKEYSQVLISIAQSDQFAAKVLAKNSKARKETAVFFFPPMY